jgi:predicted RNase H-like HicB family nuclease
MSIQFLVVRGSYAQASIYVECENCWMTNIDEPQRISTHCISLAEARQLADRLHEAGVDGSRSRDSDCPHAKADS